MRKQQNNIKLTGMFNDIPAKVHQAEDVTIFKGDSLVSGKDYFIVDHSIEGSPILVTSKGSYPLIWNNAGYFEPKQPPNSMRIHVILKKVTGKLIYWA